MWVANDYEDLSELFMALDTDNSMFSDPMQSTGLFDKNALEIFEGDVVNAFDYDSDDGKIYKTTDLTGVITYHKNAFCIQSGKILIDLWVHAEGIEIIGNIYQNSDLLESVEE
ncbi:hypothetical protein Javan425_0039 [Streptococcus phage Javan425]|nr:hypothetical protein Javan425_0039 [Streptococcus phage Javan425]